MRSILLIIAGLGLILVGIGGGTSSVPLAIIGGILTGYSLGVFHSLGAARLAVLEKAVERPACTCGDGSAEEDRSAVLRCPVHGHG
ncbi:MAG: hypothetical protein QOF36_2601 [Microbacteriaceae bacterium]|nr:hypothetical protein [Microbacteriaceae bacterium]